MILTNSWQANAQATQEQMTLFTINCLQCHARVGTHAPLIGNAKHWRARIAQGENTMLKNTIEGFNGMPPAGSCSSCNEEDLRAIIRFMVDSSIPQNKKAEPKYDKAGK